MFTRGLLILISCGVTCSLLFAATTTTLICDFLIAAEPTVPNAVEASLIPLEPKKLIILELEFPAVLIGPVSSSSSLAIMPLS